MYVANVRQLIILPDGEKSGRQPRGWYKGALKSFTNSSDGWHQLTAWLGEHKIGRVHACLEATGRYGIALALHEAGYVVSIVNPAQIRNFARAKLGRNKTDQIDSVQIREYVELFKPRPWTPPSPATRRLCELQTLRAGTVAGLNGRIAVVAA